MKKALLLCASHNDLGLIRALKKLGYYIVVTGKIPDQPGQRWCDLYIAADYSDKERILQIAIKQKVQVIVPCCNDFGVYTAAYVAEKLGLPGYDSYETTCILHNKDRFKAFACKNGIHTPKSEVFSSIENAMSYLKCCVAYPVIVKPADASAGNGTMRLDDFDGAKAVIETAFAKSKKRRIVIEPFIIGSQHGFCTFLIDGKVVAVCSNNEYSFINPYRVEIDTFPATTYEQSKKMLIADIEKIASVLKLKDGIFHLQYIFDGEKPQILEVMRRVLGNMYGVPGNQITGLDWEYWEVRARCGWSLENFPRQMSQVGYFAYKTILASGNGRIKSIVIPKSYNKYIYARFMLKQSGDEITHNMSEPIGFLFLMFVSQEEMQRVLIEEYREDLVVMETCVNE